ncbi:nickel pincer cofactor biosynthesis protein LarC [Planktothrix agardhii]|uniref:nickel pincer cofactor biosynthesis protein LarC n=1 Tax=Planktothrix agardhii TaxID=1160 RepID=UPI002B221535|nr:nickel pincer cofactor biosynthesis protein LarC [Planktothrix agardhii]MEA5563679.1 nickel pincer cofactor biosynthesis protein LarC [Planktothrix agardhii UHCC 0887]
MAKIGYFQCPTGISGDMCLGALVDAGVPIDYLKEKLDLLGIGAEYELKAEPVRRQGQLATKVSVSLTQQNSDDNVHDHEHHYHSTATRHLSQIEAIILQAKLPQQVEIRSLAIFRRLAEAEADVHGMTVEEVHFHEVGATDAIVDIVGTCLGLDWLNIEQFYCSTLPTGGGTVWAAHGQLPVPVPAVLKLFEMGKVPVYSNDIERELVTPTGAAIAVTLAQSFGEPPALSIQTIGLGAGSQDLPIPNILRLWVGEQHPSLDSDIFSTVNTEIQTITETISVLQTQIDDLSPQVIAYTFELLFQAGAIDVFSQPITMKKSRLGVLLTVICHPEHRQVCEAILFRETTTLGIRHTLQNRSILKRDIQTVETQYGAVRVKVGFSGKKITNVQPEYEDCAKLAKQHKVTWLEVHRLALQSWYGLP